MGIKKSTKFVIINIFRIFIGILFSCVIKRDKNILLFSCKPGQTGDLFLHNTKYFFLCLNEHHPEFKTIWLCDNEDIISGLKRYGYKHIYKRYSLKGIYYALRAKYWFTDYNIADTTYSFLAYNAIGINLWHGAGGLKKCAGDDKNSSIKKGSFKSKIYNFLRVKDSYQNVDSEREGIFRKSAFYAKDEQIVINGSPRLDVLYKDIADAEMFMEEDFNNIKLLKNSGKKLFFYVPTFRDTQKDISGWLKSDKLQQFLKNNNSVLICKLHPFDTNSLNFELSEEFYKMDSNSDLYAVLKYMDSMITDYSSVYFDYLLLDRPIIHYVPDLEEYQEKCRGFYEPFETLAGGEITKNEEELLNAMQDVVKGIDKFKDNRKRLRDQTFKYQDGKNCERVIEWIKSLD